MIEANETTTTTAAENGNRPWRDWEKQALVECTLDGQAIDAIAARLGRTPAAVGRMADRMRQDEGLYPLHFTKRLPKLPRGRQAGGRATTDQLSGQIAQVRSEITAVAASVVAVKTVLDEMRAEWQDLYRFCLVMGAKVGADLGVTTEDVERGAGPKVAMDVAEASHRVLGLLLPVAEDEAATDQKLD